MDPESFVMAALEIAERTEDPDAREDAIHWLADKMAEYESQKQQGGGEAEE